EMRQMLWLLLGAVCFVLVIACVNVANLLLAQGTSRQKELAVRIAIGATPGTIFAQQLAESLTLAVFGGLIGFAAAYFILRAIHAFAPPMLLPIEVDLKLHAPMLLF